MHGIYNEKFTKFVNPRKKCMSENIDQGYTITNRLFRTIYIMNLGSTRISLKSTKHINHKTLILGLAYKCSRPSTRSC